MYLFIKDLSIFTGAKLHWSVSDFCLPLKADYEMSASCVN